MTPKLVPSTLTTTESETLVATPHANTTSSSKLKVEDLEMINVLDKSFYVKSCNLTEKIANEILLNIELDKLKQYSRTSISVVELSPYKAPEKAEKLKKRSSYYN